MRTVTSDDDPLLQLIENFHCGGLGPAETSQAHELLEQDPGLRDYLSGLRSFDRLFAYALGVADGTLSPEPDTLSRFDRDSRSYATLKDAAEGLRAASLQLSGWNSPGPSRSPSPKRRSWGFGRAGGARNADSR